MEFPTKDEFAKEVAEKALDEFIYEGKTIREWVEILVKQQPCEDCISRQELLEELGEEPFNWNDSPEAFQEVSDYQWFRSLVENAPLVAPKQTSWIPVSERLPEASGDYLVTTKWKGRYSGNVYVETNMAEYRKKTKEWDCVDVIAWMPLPQAYTESEVEK